MDAENNSSLDFVLMDFANDSALKKNEGTL